MHQPIEELEVFKRFETATHAVWVLARNWQQIDRDTIGKQLVRAMDGINANLVEGDARYSGPDSLRFFVIARASAREARLWMVRSKKRRLIGDEQANELIETVDSAAQPLNRLISYRRKEGSQIVLEVGHPYLACQYDAGDAEPQDVGTSNLNT